MKEGEGAEGGGGKGEMTDSLLSSLCSRCLQERAIENEAATLGLPRLMAIRGEARPRTVLVRCHVSSLSLSGHFLLETADR